jgi:5-formyltetrahydrofolate cyclo-ligase
MRSEVDVEPLIEALLSRGCTVCIPRSDWEGGHIEPVPITDLREIDLVERGVRQPRPSLPALPVGSVEAFIVPGLAFDERGGRLGRGGGFYDRVLGDPARRAPALGICFEAQVLEDIPMEPHDQPVEAIATPARLLDFGATGRWVGRRPPLND